MALRAPLACAAPGPHGKVLLATVDGALAVADPAASLAPMRRAAAVPAAPSVAAWHPGGHLVVVAAPAAPGAPSDDLFVSDAALIPLWVAPVNGPCALFPLN